jgi:hypothetical protein
MAMNIQDEIMEQAGQEMAREIDREILWGMLQGLGWTRVNLPFKSNGHAVDIAYWVDEHIKHPFEQAGGDFIFEDQVDAVNFVLKWK